MQLVLGSASRDRKLCFQRIKYPIHIIPSDFDESSIEDNDPIRLVQRLAAAKAMDVVEKWELGFKSKFGSAIVIGADTMVLFKGELIGKAQDRNDAYNIIQKLSGNEHLILTGVALIDTKSKTTHTFVEEAKVHFKNLSKQEIDWYLDEDDEYIGRAGAYSLHDRASLFIDYVKGSPTNVIGLPMEQLNERLKLFGINLLKFSS